MAKNSEEKTAIKEKTEATNLARYGVRRPLQNDSIKTKMFDSNEEKYGTKFPTQAEEVKTRIANTNRERYGYSSPAKSEKVKAKTRETNLKKYGVTHPTQLPAVQNKMKTTMLERFGFENAAQVPEIREKSFTEKFGGPSPFNSSEVRDKVLATLMDRYGVKNPAKIPEVQARIREKFFERVNRGEITHSRVSELNKRFAKELQERFSQEVFFEAPYGDYAADLRIKDFYIELNPTVSHNSHRGFRCIISNNCSTPCLEHLITSKDYHFKKALNAKQAGVKLIQLYDWDRAEASFAFLEGKLADNFKRYSARKLMVQVINQKTANEFLAINHIQGGARNQSHCYGLYSNGELLAVATFGKSRFRANVEFEWIRYAVKSKTIIYGGARRLMRYFLENENPASIISYVNFDHTTAPNIFLQNAGFKELAPTGPSLMWHNMRSNKSVPETSLLKLGADRLLNTCYGSRQQSGMSNHDIMLAENYLPVYTAGNRVFLYNSLTQPST